MMIHHRFAMAACAALLACPAFAGQDGAAVTFTKDVLPILQENCILCHRPYGANLGGMVAPMSFMTYEETRPWAKAIGKAVTNRDMPPWDASPEHAGVFEGERVLDDAKIAVIQKWVATGATKGNPADAPAPMEFPGVDGWTIGVPDLILTMPEPFFVPDDLLDGTKYFPAVLTEEQLPKDRWIKAVEFRAGSEAVHHIIVSPFGGVAPGNVPNTFREGYGALVKKGAKVTWNMHYHKEPGPGTGVWDQSSLAVVFYPEDYTPKHVLTTLPLGPMDFAIPAGDPNYAASAEFTFAKDALIYEMMPHMHFRGTKVFYELTYPTGTKETLLNVPAYDFNWQTVYTFKEPKAVPAGTTVKFTGWWDNSANNPSNPDPSKTVTWGEATHEEMLFGWVSFANANEDATAHQGYYSGGGHVAVDSAKQSTD